MARIRMKKGANFEAVITMFHCFSTTITITRLAPTVAECKYYSTMAQFLHGIPFLSGSSAIGISNQSSFCNSLHDPVDSGIGYRSPMGMS